MQQNSTFTESRQTQSQKMNSETISFKDTGIFSGIFLDYISKSKALEKFYNVAPEIKNFPTLIDGKEFEDEKRETLFSVLSQQYQSLDVKDAASQNLVLLKKSNTFTITTGHQLNILSGPLYFIYKIVSVINACKKLNKQFPDYNFVPVYWMAGEDHDFEEINHFNLFGKKFEWHSEQSGPVGKFDPRELKELLEGLPEKMALFEKAYLEHSTLSEATRYYVNELFGMEGLIVLDSDHESFKRSFIPIIKDDLKNHHANKLVEDESEKLAQAGYKTQVFPRSINFFYMEKGSRERIVHEGGQYKVLNTQLEFTEQEMMSLVDTNPEKFSPNVILRPLYQECILPNLAYIGGPGELAYWLQLKGVFDHYEVQYPMLIPRNHALIVNKGNQKKLNKLDLMPSDLFQGFQSLKDKFLKAQDAREIDLSNQREEISLIFKQIINLSKEVDGSLEGFVAAEENKSLKSLDNIEKRLKKSEESKSEVSLQQIKSILDKLFPNGVPQERNDNFLNFYINNPEFIQILLKNFNPFELSFTLLMDE